MRVRFGYKEYHLVFATFKSVDGFLVGTVVQVKVFSGVWNAFDGHQSIADGDPAIGGRGSPFHHLGDVNSVIPGNVLITNASCN